MVLGMAASMVIRHRYKERHHALRLDLYEQLQPNLNLK
jgi:hypothetical protein